LSKSGLTDDLLAQVVAHCTVAYRADSWLDVVGGLQALPGCSLSCATRKKILFEQAGFVVTAYPVDFGVEARQTTPMEFLSSARSFKYADAAVREFLGRGYDALF
jgi:hypothetical protein